MINNIGLTAGDKKRIDRLMEQGLPVATVARALRCTPELVTRYNESKKAKIEPSSPKRKPTKASG